MALPRVLEQSAALLAIGDRFRSATRPPSGVPSGTTPTEGGRPVTFFGACIFAGAFGIGAKLAGGTMIGGVESAELPFGIRTAQQGWPVIVEPQASWSNRSLATKLRTALGDQVPDVLVMNPPCSAYAKNGKRGGMADPVMCNLHACIDFAFGLAPPVWVWELVPGIFTDPDGRAFLDGLAARSAAAGYRSYAFLTSSALHGGHQKRERFHFIASRVQLDFEATLRRQPTERSGWRPVRDAILDIPAGTANTRVVPCGSLDMVLPHVPPGTYINQIPDSVLERVYKPRGKAWTPDQGRPGVSRIRAMWDRPSATIVGGASVVHPDEDRFLTVRENARLMGFPDSWEFPEGSAGYQEVGKGLTVHTARFVCEAIIDGLRAGTTAAVVPTLDVVDIRDRVVAPGLTSDDAFKREWYLARHGVEWTGGSRTTAGTTRSRVRTVVDPVRIATDSETVRAKCESMGIGWTTLATAVANDVAIVEVVDDSPLGLFGAAFALGSCISRRRIICCALEGIQLPAGIEVISTIDNALDLVAAHAAPVLRAKLARQLSELPDDLLMDAIAAIAALVTANIEEISEPEEVEE